MNSLSRWDPLRELDDLQHRLSSFFGRTPVRREGDKQEDLRVAEWAPLVDISEDEKEYLIKADLPEVKKEDVKVSVKNDVLSISGERKYEKEEKSKRYHRVERAYGSFARSFTIPEDTDAQLVSGEFKDGVLKVHLPKSPKVQPKSVEVNVE